MPFNSIIFLISFLFFLILYYAFENIKTKTFLLVFGSYLFYAYSNIFNLVFLIITTIITFKIASLIKRQSSNKNLLALGIIIIITQLILTKYSSNILSEFLITNSSENEYFNFLILPIGISFYSLQAIGLLVDINKGRYKGETSLIRISQFLSFFPQSLSGPIHRGNELIPQFTLLKKLNSENIIIGFKTMLWGYFCKLIIADKISLIITPIFNSHLEQDGLTILIASLLYSLQIYFDFLGYSLIAIGVGKTLGFTINLNFHKPYLAKSFKEFWHRWHITLSQWMRDYIYIPLGGSKQKTYSLFCITILLTFLVSGFWHGATLNFILWGAVHAFLYLAEDVITKLFQKISLSNIFSSIIKLIQPFRVVFFFITITFTWIIFRTENTSGLVTIYKSILSFSNWETLKAFNYYTTTNNLFFLVIILITFFLTQIKFISRLIETVSNSIRELVTDSIFICLCIIMILFFGDIGTQEFLYFRF